MKSIYLLSAFILTVLFTNAQTQPLQPTTGPGSDNFTYTAVDVSDFGTNGNGDGFWIFEPTPKPDSANVVVFIHGWGMVNPKYYGAFINRIVRSGNIVIYPRYQRLVESDNATYTDSCARGIQRALEELAKPGHVKPKLYNWFVLGHSMGGVLTANMTTRYQQYSIPKPLAAFSMQPGADIAALLLNPAEYANFPADVKYLIVAGNDDIVVGSTPGMKLFNQTTAVPTTHKNFVKHYADNHGSPAITATHAEPGSTYNAFDSGESNWIVSLGGTAAIDAVDYYCYWKLWDALYDCALNGQNCDVAFGDTEKQKSMGNWSDGTPVRVLEVIPAAATGINSISEPQVLLYPNPSTGDYIYLNVEQLEAGTLFNLFDVEGRLVLQQQVKSNNTGINAPFVQGLYFYNITNGSSGIIAKGKIVIE